MVNIPGKRRIKLINVLKCDRKGRPQGAESLRREGGLLRRELSILPKNVVNSATLRRGPSPGPGPREREKGVKSVKLLLKPGNITRFTGGQNPGPWPPEGEERS